MSGQTLRAAGRRAAQTGDFGDVLAYLAVCELEGVRPCWTGAVATPLVQLLEVRAAQRRGGGPAEVWSRYRAVRSVQRGAPLLSQARVQNRAHELAQRGSETRLRLAGFLRHVRAAAPAARPYLRTLLAGPDERSPAAAATVLMFLGALGGAGGGPAARRAATRSRRPTRRLPLAWLLSPAGVAGLAAGILALGLAWQLARTGAAEGAAYADRPVATLSAGRD
jgi:hypothetical protein